MMSCLIRCLFFAVSVLPSAGQLPPRDRQAVSPMNKPFAPSEELYNKDFDDEGMAMRIQSSDSYLGPHMGEQRQPPDETIVIVGAGSIGLSTAYNLALSARDAAKSRNIIVLDSTSNPFGATSGTCTGCLHYEFREPEGDRLVELGQYSFELWEALSTDEKFRSAVGYRDHSLFEINPGTGQGLNELPDWFRTDSAWKIDDKVLHSPSAMVNPKGVGAWLASECRRLGVDIRLSSTVTSVDLTSHNTIQSVQYETDGNLKRVYCQSLVVAAGPWTPTMFHKLFPKSPISLKSALNAGDWILFRNPFPLTKKSIAFIALDDIVDEKLEFTGRNDGTIWLIGRNDSNATLPPLGKVASPNCAMINELIDRAKRHLSFVDGGVGQDGATLEIIDKGRAIRPATNSLLPVISSVKAEDLSDDVGSSSDSSGVFVSWGHGSYGLTLGMGTGKILSQLVLGEETDIDISLFDITRDKKT